MISFNHLYYSTLYKRLTYRQKLYYIDIIYKMTITNFVSLLNKIDKYVNHRTKIPTIF